MGRILGGDIGESESQDVQRTQEGRHIHSFTRSQTKHVLRTCQILRGAVHATVVEAVSLPFHPGLRESPLVGSSHFWFSSPTHTHGPTSRGLIFLQNQCMENHY